MIQEVELLLRCARTQLAPGAVERIEEILQGPLDWDLIQKHGRDHGLLALVARTLVSSNRFFVPPEARKNLEDFHRQNAERSLALSAELLKVIVQLEQSGIAVIGYQGPVLAAVAYGDVGLRQFSELNVLLRPQDAPRARELFLSLGYQPEFEFSAKQDRAYRRVASEYNFRTNSGIQVELLWRVLPTYYALDFDVNGAFSRLVTIELSGSQVRTLSPEDTLLTLTLHGSSYAWWRLQYVCDVAHVISTFPQLNWPQVWQHARKLGMMRLLRIALTLAAGLFGAPISRTQEAEIKRDQTALQLAAELAASLTSLNTGGSLKAERLLMKGRERWRDRARYLVERVIRNLASQLSQRGKT